MSVLYGKDIVIYDRPNQNQRKVAICSAFNGWLYAAILYQGDTNMKTIVLKSVDNGLNWDSIGYCFNYSGNWITKKVEIVSYGVSVQNIKIFVGGLFYDTITQERAIRIVRFNGYTGAFESTVQAINSENYDISLVSNNDSSDLPIIGLLYDGRRIDSKHQTVLDYSVDGGYNFYFVIIAVYNYPHIIDDVSLSYGKCVSSSQGKFFAAWKVKDSPTSDVKHIYTSHSLTNYSSSFTVPVCIDSINPSDISLCRNPEIGCQYGQMDNDSSNLTSVILYEKYDPVSGNYDVKGYYNLQATSSSCFRPLSFTNSSHNNLQQDIAFNPYDSSFLVTWFDSTTKQLRCVKNDFNISNPNSWMTVSTGYNDQNNISAPYPSIIISDSEKSSANAWISDGTEGEGIALFDAQYSSYTAIPEFQHEDKIILYGSFPNPCKEKTIIEFELKNPSQVSIVLYTIPGQPILVLFDRYYPKGKNHELIDVSDISAGCYLYKIQSDRYTVSGLLIISN
jgi:hypothetical protein